MTFGGDNSYVLLSGVGDFKITPPVRTKRSPSAVVVGDKVYCFYPGFDDASTMWWSAFSLNNDFIVTGQDGPHQVPSTLLTGYPSAVSFNDAIYVFHRGQNGELYYNKRSNDGNWSGERAVGVAIECSPSAIVYDNAIHIFYQGPSPHECLRTSVLDQFEKQQQLDFTLPSAGLSESPTTVIFQNNLYVLYQGMGHCGELWYSVYDTGQKKWSDSQGVSSGSTMLSSSPSAISTSKNLYVFHRAGGESHHVQRAHLTASGNWYVSDDTSAYSKDSPGAVMWKNNSCLVFHRADDDSSELYYMVMDPDHDHTEATG